MADRLYSQKLIGEYMGEPEDFGWWESIKERTSFYGVITTGILIDAVFFLCQRAIVLGFNWCSGKLHTAENAGISSQHTLEGVLDWGTFSLVVCFVFYDMVKVVRKLWRRLKKG